jgi:hypothetical protein
MADPVRLQCLHAVQASLQSMAPPTYSAEFSQVRIGPLLDEDSRKLRSAGIVAGRETKITEYPLMDCTLPVEIELRMMWNSTDPGLPAELMEIYMGEVQKQLSLDYTLGGIAIDFRETGNEQELNSWRQKAIYTVLHYVLRYRHQIMDPTVIA